MSYTSGQSNAFSGYIPQFLQQMMYESSAYIFSHYSPSSGFMGCFCVMTLCEGSGMNESLSLDYSQVCAHILYKLYYHIWRYYSSAVLNRYFNSWSSGTMWNPINHTYCVWLWHVSVIVQRLKHCSEPKTFISHSIHCCIITGAWVGSCVIMSLLQIALHVNTAVYLQPSSLQLSSSQPDLFGACVISQWINLETKSICLETSRNQNFIGTNLIHIYIFSVYRAFEPSLTSLFCLSLQQNTSQRKTF